MNARKIMKPKKAAKAVAPKKESPASKGAKRTAAKPTFDSDEEPTTSKRPKPPKSATSAGKQKAAKTSPGKAKAAPTSPGKAKAASPSPSKAKAAPAPADKAKAKVAKTSPGKAKAAKASPAKAKAAPPSKSKARGKSAAIEEPKRKARGAGEEPAELEIEVDEIDTVSVTDDESELEENPEAAAGTISEDDDALDEAEDESDSRERSERPDPLMSDISEIRPRDENDEEALRAAAALELGEELSADSQPAPTTRAHLKRVVESLIFVADQAVTANQLARLVKAKQAEVREVVTEIMRDYDGRGIELVEVGGGFQFRSAAASAPFVRDLVSARPVRLTRAQLETLALIAYRQPVTRPEIDDVRGVDSGSAIKVLLDRDLVKILGRKDEPGRPLLYGTAPQFLEFFGMKSLQDLPTLREFTELSEENRELFAKKMGEVPSDLSLDPSNVHTFEYDEEGNPILREPEPELAAEDSDATPTDAAVDTEAGGAEPEARTGEPTEDDAADADDADDADDVPDDADAEAEVDSELGPRAVDESDDDDEDSDDEDEDDDESEEDSDDEGESDDADDDDEPVAEDDSDDQIPDEDDEDDDEDSDEEDESDEDESAVSPDDDTAVLPDDEVVAEVESEDDEPDEIANGEDESEESDEDEDEDEEDSDDEDEDEIVAQNESEGDDDEDSDDEDEDESEDDADDESEGDDDDEDSDDEDEDDEDEDSAAKPS